MSVSIAGVIALTSPGRFRGLGVHISFVRSITMDSFKAEEILRMDKGGNRKCKAFFAAAAEFREGMSIAEQYGSDFGEDYKEKVPPFPPQIGRAS